MGFSSFYHLFPGEKEKNDLIHLELFKNLIKLFFNLY